MEFQTYWVYNGDRKITDWVEVEQLLEQGKAVVEVTADMQQRAHERKAKIEAAYAEAQVKWEKRLLQLHHERTPQGQREAAVRFAQEHPGGYVSGGGFGIEELDRYGVESTKLR